MSNQQWILGSDCTQNVLKLWDSFQRKRVLEFQKLGFEAKHYHPWSWIVSERPDLSGLLNFKKRNEGHLLISETEELRLVDDAMADADGLSMGRASRDIRTTILFNIDEKFPAASKLVSDAVKLQALVTPWINQVFQKMIWGIIPLYHEQDGQPWRRGFSSMDCPGLIFTSFLERVSTLSTTARAQMTVDLAHELGHHVLMIYQCADRIIDGDLAAPVYSSVRRTFRPAIMSFHAAFAMAYMMNTCVSIAESSEASPAEREYARLSLRDFEKHQLACLQELKVKCAFTLLGHRMMREMQHQLDVVTVINQKAVSGC